MEFNIFNQDITLDEVKNRDGIKFIDELGLEGEAKETAVSNYLSKSLLTFAKDESLFEKVDETVRYLDKEEDLYIIVTRKQYEQKTASLVIDVKALTMAIRFNLNGEVKEKTFDSSTKIKDIVKAYNTAIKALNK